jgi:hypothetical protein
LFQPLPPRFNFQDNINKSISFVGFNPATINFDFIHQKRVTFFVEYKPKVQFLFFNLQFKQETYETNTIYCPGAAGGYRGKCANPIHQKISGFSRGITESVGISAERLARIDKMCTEAVQSGDLPGIVSLVARNGKIVHWKAYGMADNQAGRALKRDNIFESPHKPRPLLQRQ